MVSCRNVQRTVLFFILCILFCLPAYAQPLHSSVTDYLKTKSTTSCVVPDSNVGARVCGRWNPNTPYPNPASANYTQQFIARYGVEPGKGNTTGERYSPTNVEVVARHPSNPLNLASNRTYNETPSDQWDLLYVFVGGVSGYDHLLNVGRSLGVIAAKPGRFNITGPAIVGLNSTHTYFVPANSDSRSRWLWVIDRPNKTRLVLYTNTNQLPITFNLLGSYSVAAVSSTTGSEGNLTVVVESGGGVPPNPPVDPPVEPDPEPPVEPEPDPEPDPDPGPTPPTDPSLLTSCELVELLRVRLSCPQ